MTRSPSTRLLLLVAVLMLALLAGAILTALVMAGTPLGTEMPPPRRPTSCVARAAIPTCPTSIAG